MKPDLIKILVQQDGLAALGILDDVKLLITKYNELKNAIEKHRAATEHELCWENDDELHAVLGDGRVVDHTPPPWCEFMERCAQYRASRERRSDG